MQNTPTYKPPFWLFNGHLETIFPSLCRSVKIENYNRERVDTPDGDFLDLDWINKDNEKLVILCHGLEGDSYRPYMKGMARALSRGGFDITCMNFRGCSGEMNRKPRFYHSGATDDLETVLEHVINQNKYNRIYIIGFSLGGNMILKYLGEKGHQLNPLIKKAMAISVPLDLSASCLEIAKKENILYEKRFLKSLKNKIIRKTELGLLHVDIPLLKKVSSVWEFDEHFTAPLHGFKNARDYYEKCSALGFIEKISIPTLILNAQNDTFLSETCYPETLLREHPFVHLETPKRGGHVGFSSFREKGMYWSEKRAVEFFIS